MRAPQRSGKPSDTVRVGEKYWVEHSQYPCFLSFLCFRAPRLPNNQWNTLVELFTKARERPQRSGKPIITPGAGERHVFIIIPSTLLDASRGY